MPIALPLVALDVVVVVLWCIAVALAISLVMSKLSTILAGVPWVGGKLSDAVKSMAQAVSNAAGTLESGIDNLIGGAWHALARYIDKLWNEFVVHSHVVVQLAHIVGNLALRVSGLHTIGHTVVKLAHEVRAGFKHLEREWHGIEHRVRSLERKIGRGIGHDLRIRIKALERFEQGAEAAIEHTIPTAIAGAEADIASLKRWLGVKLNISYKDWVAGLVLAGLAALGLSGLNCKNLKDPLAKRGCGYWDDLAALLGLATIAVEAANFEELVKEAQSLEHEVVLAIKELWGLP